MVSFYAAHTVSRLEGARPLIITEKQVFVFSIAIYFALMFGSSNFLFLKQSLAIFKANIRLNLSDCLPSYIITV